MKKDSITFLLLLLLISYKMFKKVIKEIIEIHTFKNAIGLGTFIEASVEMYVGRNVHSSYKKIT